MDLHALDESVQTLCPALTSADQLIHRQLKAVQPLPREQQPQDWICIRVPAKKCSETPLIKTMTRPAYHQHSTKV